MPANPYTPKTVITTQRILSVEPVVFRSLVTPLTPFLQVLDLLPAYPTDLIVDENNNAITDENGNPITF